MLTESDEIVREGDLAIRRMRHDAADHELMVRWRNEPHVAEWWNTDDEPTLLETTAAIGGTLADPIKTTNVQNVRCMTTWVVEK